MKLTQYEADVLLHVKGCPHRSGEEPRGTCPACVVGALERVWAAAFAAGGNNEKIHAANALLRKGA